MVRFGAVRNSSLLTGTGEKYPAQGSVLKDAHGANLECQFGQVFTTKIENIEVLVKVINLRKFQLFKRHSSTNAIKSDDACLEIDLLRLFNNCTHLPYFYGVTMDHENCYVYIKKSSQLFEYLVNWHKQKASEKQMNSATLEKMLKQIFFDILLGVDYLHKHGYTHGDIKLENIVYERDMANFCQSML
eukprot:UN23758